MYNSQSTFERVCIEGIASNWRYVLSGVSQGSLLGPLLFIIFINDLELRIINTVLKFADDTKVFGSVLNEQDRMVLQQDLQKLSEWADIWQMKFNVPKCRLIHFGSHNSQFTYHMKGKQLEEVNSEKDLEVIISSNLKVADHCHHAYAAANRMLVRGQLNLGMLTSWFVSTKVLYAHIWNTLHPYGIRITKRTKYF